ncbi:hypothetical protein BIFADO_02015 [Bifidobacterium adolescentis L2-32]|uniref:Uncharacterized protein n=1 Tax=Bifidobacterium adolescentis L2-32 TaxID=411481 RepID=A7A825_BIFAD|nr:hypothetical protein BIFADO_02015 [Bifidobacterium adolescentis L2-32]
MKSMVKRKRNGVADCCDADDVDDSFANVTCMLLMRFICETLADMGTWRPYNGVRRSCPGRAGRGTATATAAISNLRCAASTKARIHHGRAIL